MHAYVYTYIHVYIRVYIYTYARTCIHTCIHAYEVVQRTSGVQKSAWGLFRAHPVGAQPQARCLGQQVLKLIIIIHYYSLIILFIH